MRLFLFVAWSVLLARSAFADYPHEFLVTVHAQAQLSPTQLQFTWEDFGASVNVYRIDPREKTGLGSDVWGTAIATLPAGTTTWSDNSVIIGKAYEYRFELIGGVNTLHPSVRNSYVAAGVDMAPQHQRGRLLLIVDNTLTSALESELLQLQEDLVGDGWRVSRQDVSQTISPVALKNLIISLYQQSPQDTKTLYLLGKLPVVKSGCISIDQHDPRPHPTDSFYADIDGIWTDTTNFDCPIGNRAGDGRFDQFEVPSAIEMGVGRVDFSNLPDYSETPTELTRRYLDKAHRYRHAEFKPGVRSIIFNDGVSISAGVNIIPVTGVWDVLDMNVRTTPRTDLWQEMQNKNFLWLFKGGGGGTGDGMAQIGTTATFAASPGVNVPFWGVLGSGNGYWDIANAFSRGIIASRGSTLAFVWADRPVWRLHILSAGQTFGDATALTINQSGKYWEGLYLSPLQTNLLGDPALRISTVPPVGNVQAAVSSQGVSLSWSAADPTALGYFVSRAANKNGPYTLLTPQPIVGTSFRDTTANSGAFFYMVRTAARETNGGGSLINVSQGKFISAIISNPVAPAAPENFRTGR